jgi:hypothetical protein
MASIKHAESPRPRVLPEKAGRMLRADVRKAESDDSMAEIGEVLDFARRMAGFSLKELAGALGRDERQVQRWIDGKENTNIAAVFAVPELRKPFVIALARLTGDCEEETTLRFVRRA